MKNIITNAICIIFIVLSFLLVTCKPGPDNDEYNNPNAGQTRDISFSHDSGLYENPFSLTLSALGKDIYYTTDGSVPVPNKTGTTKYTTPISVVNRTNPVQPNVLATPQNSFNFYMAAGDPRDHFPPPYIPTNEQVPKATVIRAITVDSSGKAGDVLTRTYFIGNNLATYGNVRVISIVSDPEGLVSEETGIMVRGKESNRWGYPPSSNIYNFNQRGHDWERTASFEMFEGNATSRTLRFATNVGLRVRGGYSRGHGQKAFNIYFREERGGINNFIRSEQGFELIPGMKKADGTPLDRVKSFMFRTGGQDAMKTKFHDVFIHSLVSDRKFDTQASVPAVIYLNGEYWGPSNMSERYSDHFYQNKYGVNRDNVIIVDSNSLDEGFDTDMAYFDAMLAAGALDMSVQANYEYFCSLVDIDNFIDYWAVQMYIFNLDWPNNNYVIWRTRNKENNSYGDTKWRYSLHDSESSLGIYSGGNIINSDYYNNTNTDIIGRMLIDGGDFGLKHRQLFKNLAKNEEFCRKFVNVMLDLYNVNFHPDIFNQRLEYYDNLYRSLMAPDGSVPGFFSRWGDGWPGDYYASINNMRRYLTNIRYPLIKDYLPKYFGGGHPDVANIGITSDTLREVTLFVEGLSSASITINDFTPASSGSWTGVFNTSGGVTVTASAPPGGYEFGGWSVTGGTAVNSSALETTINFTASNATIIAIYKQQGVTYVNPTGITLSAPPANLKIGDSFTLTPSFSPADTSTQITYKTLTWSSSRPNIFEVDGNGKVTVKSGGTAVITAASIIAPDVKTTIDITASAIFMADPHTEGIKFIINKNLVQNKNRWIQIRPSGWGNGARIGGMLNEFADTNGIIEIIYPFTQSGKTYSFDVELDSLHTVTETAGGGVGELIINSDSEFKFNIGTQTLSVDANLSLLNDSNSKLDRAEGGWRIVLRKGTNWNDTDYDDNWFEINNWNGGLLGYDYIINKSISVQDIQENFSWIYDRIKGGNVFALLYYDAYYNGFRFDSGEISTTFRLLGEPVILPGETLIGSYDAYQSNPYIDLTSSAPYDIVTISGKTGYVMKVSNPNCWELNQWEIALKNFGDQYKGRNVYIDFSVEVFREGESGNIAWQVNNDGSWPTIGAIWGASQGTWHKITAGMNGNGSVIPTADSPMFYLSAWDEDENNPPGRNARTVFYIANYSMEVIPR